MSVYTAGQRVDEATSRTRNSACRRRECDHDRNTLRVRVEAEGDLVKLEPGTTVWLKR
jgi:hypothetical protein